MSSPPRAKSRYHHGDLRRSLLDAALLMLREQGVESFSLRKLGERVGVSAPAIYHHFQHKLDLLAALAEEGLQAFEQGLGDALARPASTLKERFEHLALAYIDFALAQPELYELMMGRTLWRHPECPYTRRARASFRRYTQAMAAALPEVEQPLRLAQITWSTLHGLVRMYNDGLAFARSDVEAIARRGVTLVLLQLQPSDADTTTTAADRPGCHRGPAPS